MMMQRRSSSRRARAFSSSRVETVLMAGSIRIGSAPAGPSTRTRPARASRASSRRTCSLQSMGDPTAPPWPRPLLQGPALGAYDAPSPEGAGHTGDRGGRYRHIWHTSSPVPGVSGGASSPSAIILLPPGTQQVRAPRHCRSPRPPGSAPLNARLVSSIRAGGVTVRARRPCPCHRMSGIACDRGARCCSHMPGSAYSPGRAGHHPCSGRTCRSNAPSGTRIAPLRGATTGSGPVGHGTSDAVPPQGAVCCVADSQAQRQAAAH